MVLGYGAAVKDHVSIAAKTRIAAKAGVVRDIEEAGDYAGHPAMLAKEYKQQVLLLLLLLPKLTEGKGGSRIARREQCYFKLLQTDIFMTPIPSQVAAAISSQRQPTRESSAKSANQQPSSSELTPSG